jgi:hypothetical protein
MQKNSVTFPISREQVEAMAPSFAKAVYEEALMQALGMPTSSRRKSKPQATNEPPRRKGGNRRKKRK